VTGNSAIEPDVAQQAVIELGQLASRDFRSLARVTRASTPTTTVPASRRKARPKEKEGTSARAISRTLDRVDMT
jgi:hypothetical protein